MVPGVVQIDVVLPVRAPAVNVVPLPQGADASQSAASVQAAAKVVQTVQAPRQAPVTDDREIRLTVNEDTHEVIATLVDIETNEVIREIPAAEMRRASEVARAITGQLINKIV